MTSKEEIEIQLKKRDRIRYTSIMMYSALIVLFTLVNVIEDFAEFGVTAYLVLTFGGFIFMLIIIVYPYYRPIETDIEEDNFPSSEYTQDGYYEEVVLSMVYYLTVPFIVLYSVVSVWMLIQRTYDEALIFAFVMLFFLIILVLFQRMELIGDSKELLIKFGPFKERLQLNDIRSSRSTEIRPLRTFLGYGKRISGDGAIGYITGHKTGVRFEYQDKKKYVLSSNQPEILVSYLRSMKKRNNQE